MNIGIIFYSHTGYTRFLMKALEENLRDDGHQVNLEEIRITGKLDLTALTVPIENKPDVNTFDLIIFASPTHGGRISAPLKSCLDGIKFLKGKKVICLATHFLIAKWGLNQTLDQMKTLCESKGAQVIAIQGFWGARLDRKRQMARFARKMQDLMRNSLLKRKEKMIQFT